MASPDDLLASALKLPTNERHRIAREPVLGLDQDDDEVAAGWTTEIERRVEEVIDGQVEMTDGEDVHEIPRDDARFTRFIATTIPRIALAISLVLAAPAGCGTSKSSAVKLTKIEALGVQVELPDGWNYVRVSKQHRLAKSDSFFAYLTPLAEIPADVPEPITKVAYDVGGKVQNVPYVRVIVPVGDQAVECHGAVMAPGDPDELLNICRAVRPLTR